MSELLLIISGCLVASALAGFLLATLVAFSEPREIINKDRLHWIGKGDKKFIIFKNGKPIVLKKF